MLQADWIEHKKGLLFSIGLLFLIWILILWASLRFGSGVGTEAQHNFFFCICFGALIAFCSFAGRKVFRSKGLYYTLPAGNGEKYFTLLLEGLIYFLAFHLVFWGALYVCKLFVAWFEVIPFQLYYIDSESQAMGSESLLTFLASLFFLSYLSFRRRPFLIALGGIVGYSCLFALLLFKCISGLVTSTGTYLDTSSVSDAFTLMFAGFRPAMLVSTAVVMYVAYLKLKERELR
jgi:hypothetical protein